MSMIGEKLEEVAKFTVGRGPGGYDIVGKQGPKAEQHAPVILPIITETFSGAYRGGEQNSRPEEEAFVLRKGTLYRIQWREVEPGASSYEFTTTVFEPRSSARWLRWLKLTFVVLLLMVIGAVLAYLGLLAIKDFAPDWYAWLGLSSVKEGVEENPSKVTPKGEPPDTLSQLKQEFEKLPKSEIEQFLKALADSAEEAAKVGDIQRTLYVEVRYLRQGRKTTAEKGEEITLKSAAAEQLYKFFESLNNVLAQPKP